MKNIPYHEGVGSLMYAAVGTHPNIVFAVSTLAQFSENPGQVHWDAVKHVFHYLNGTKELALTCGGGETGKGCRLEGFSDTDGTSQEHRHMITGYAFLIDGGTVSWSSKKQELVTLSTTEAEYIASSHTSCEVLWLCCLISEIFHPLKLPTPLYCDNQSAITLTQNDNYHVRTKHIDIQYHFIHYVIEEGHIKLIYCPTDEIITANILTLIKMRYIPILIVLFSCTTTNLVTECHESDVPFFCFYRSMTQHMAHALTDTSLQTNPFIANPLLF
jgi:hypothetical protein